MKTNKSYAKRIRVTKRGKLLARKPGQNHFNAKARRATQLSKKRGQAITLDAKKRARFLPG